MKKAIGYRFAFVLVFALLISGTISYIVAGNQMLKGTTSHLEQLVHTIDYSLDYDGNIQEQVLSFKENAIQENDRITILKLDGSVCADTNTKDYASLENHSDREEVKEALAEGFGYSIRHSDTLGKDMMYVACISDNGEYIIRLAVYYEGLTDYMKVLLPSLFLAFVIILTASIIMAFRFTGDITKPLNEIADEMLNMQGENPEFNFKTYKYEELNIISYTTDKLTENVKEYIDKVNFEKKVRQEFFSNASHELKTPITSIKGYAEILINHMAGDKEGEEDCIRRIIAESDNMASLINDILLISKLETNEITEDMTEVRLYPLVSEVAQSLKPIADANQVSVRLECQPVMANCSAQQMRVLFSNLMANAITYNVPEGSVSVRVGREKDDIVITVQDTGIGIPKEDQERIFERFYRVDKGRSKKLGGTGLGLSIVKHIVAYYEGELSLESELDKGSTFTIRMPIAIDR